MSRDAALVKLAKAAKLSAEAARLNAEAVEELAADGTSSPTPTPSPVSEVDVARARRVLRRLGTSK